MRVELRKIQKEMGQTAIFSTPDDAEAMSMADKIAVLDKGRLVQYDAVDSVYHRPKSLYVAMNLGSPQINTVEGELSVDGGKTLLDLGFAKLDLSFLSDVLTKFSGKKVVLGFRPHYVEISKEGLGGLSIKGSVEAVEYMGSESYAIVSLGSSEASVLLPPNMRVEPGSEVWLNINTSRMHLFDASSGETIV